MFELRHRDKLRTVTASAIQNEKGTVDTIQAVKFYPALSDKLTRKILLQDTQVYFLEQQTKGKIP